MNIEQDRRIQHLVFVLVRVFDVYLFLIRHVRVDYFPVEIVDHVHHINAVHLVFHVCLPVMCFINIFCLVDHGKVKNDFHGRVGLDMFDCFIQNCLCFCVCLGESDRTT